MTTRLVIGRHGNTFDPGDVVRRVGARTDLPLSTSGRLQAERLGQALANANLLPDIVFTAPLLRTRQTAELALAAMPLNRNIQILPQLTEIDYGPDEGMPEIDVVTRIGAQALRNWEEEQIVPAGWLVDPEALLKMWRELATQVLDNYTGKTVLCITSNGIARFALGLGAEVAHRHTAKLATGAYGILKSAASGWHIENWNTRP